MHQTSRFDQHGYPTEETCRLIAEWPLDDAVGCFEFLQICWRYPEYFSASPDKEGGWRDIDGRLERP